MRKVGTALWLRGPCASPGKGGTPPGTVTDANVPRPVMFLDYIARQPSHFVCLCSGSLSIRVLNSRGNV
jgi:hypothetical protein